MSNKRLDKLEAAVNLPSHMLARVVGIPASRLQDWRNGYVRLNMHELSSLRMVEKAYKRNPHIGRELKEELKNRYRAKYAFYLVLQTVFEKD